MLFRSADALIAKAAGQLDTHGQPLLEGPSYRYGKLATDDEKCWRAVSRMHMIAMAVGNLMLAEMRIHQSADED